jgi:hypothetical protein
MVTSNAPVRVPERQAETNTTPRPSSWPQAKKPARFVIKVAGSVPY